MKKYIFAFGIVALFLVSCGSGDSNSNKEETHYNSDVDIGEVTCNSNYTVDNALLSIFTPWLNCNINITGSKNEVTISGKYDLQNITLNGNDNMIYMPSGLKYTLIDNGLNNKIVFY